MAGGDVVPGCVDVSFPSQPVLRSFAAETFASGMTKKYKKL